MSHFPNVLSALETNVRQGLPGARREYERQYLRQMTPLFRVYLEQGIDSTRIARQVQSTAAQLDRYSPPGTARDCERLARRVAACFCESALDRLEAPGGSSQRMNETVRM
jgi:nucleotidyltransferase/DNA polymerase involved in DNA repair